MNLAATNPPVGAPLAIQKGEPRTQAWGYTPRWKFADFVSLFSTASLALAFAYLLFV